MENITIPIAERDPDDIRKTLTTKAGQPAEVVQAFVDLQAYAKRTGLGLSALAGQSRISQGVLSPAFNGTYNGSYTNVSEKIIAFFRRIKAKEQYGDIRQFTELQLARYLWLTFEKTTINRKIQIIEGPEQCGKTRAALEYRDRNNHGRSVYVEISGGSNCGVSDFIRALGQACGIPYTIHLNEIKLRIRNNLESADIVIIDEAHLPWKWTRAGISQFLDYLRTDVYANGARGVVLIATNEDFFARLRDFKRTGYNVGQLLGRMRAEAIRIDPAEHIIEEDIKALVGRYYSPGKKAVAALHDIALRPQLGHFGLILDIMNEAWLAARKRKDGLDDDTVLVVAERIMNRLKERKALYE
jgi:hypothetical protein